MGYADFAKNLAELPAPKQYDDEQKEMFRAEVEQKAQPLEDKAIEALEKALAKAYELSVYNEWTLQAQDTINKYRPGYYPKVKDVPFQGSEVFATAPLAKGPNATAKVDPPPEAPKSNTLISPTASRGAGSGER
jgi:hypothetical protein